jgi:hypothetical protein
MPSWAVAGIAVSAKRPTTNATVNLRMVSLLEKVSIWTATTDAKTTNLRSDSL